MHTGVKVVFGWILFTFNPFRVVDQWVMKLLFTLNPFGIPKNIFTLVYTDFLIRGKIVLCSVITR